MIRSVARKHTLLAVSALFVSAMTAGCNNSSKRTTSGGGKDVDPGSAQFSLVVNGAVVDSIHYQIDDLSTPPPAGPAAKLGDVLVPGAGPNASFLVSGLQPDHYHVDLSATAHATDVSTISCSGSATFDVAAGVTAHVHVTLTCGEARNKGSVAINATVNFNDCPYITSYLLSSTQVAPGGTVAFGSTAADLDASLIPGLAFSWVDGNAMNPGAFDHANAASGVFTCPAGGASAHTLTLTVTNGKSSDAAACNALGARESILVLCVNTACGNGHTDPGESCDHGVNNGAAGDTCDYFCQSSVAVCGNGVTESFGATPEQCDDHNTVSNDGCSATCQTEHAVCGDGIRQNFGTTAEGCDDGNLVSGDGCSATCQSETQVCGNGSRENFGPTPEQCDDRNTVSGDGCSATCQNEAQVCGDGIRQNFGATPEACDDHNLVAGDGCSPTCQNEVQVCGDGIRQNFGTTPEQCDDGNLTNLDGCSSTCTTESACFRCEETNRGGVCSATMGCAGLSTTAGAVSTTNPLGLSPFALCNNMLSCMRANPSCWVGAASISCFCGAQRATDTSTFCGDPYDTVADTGPHGVCVTQTFQAAQTTASSTAGTRFTSTSFPVGRATQVIACDKNACGAATAGVCAP